jgi:phage-related minor tail protein
MADELSRSTTLTVGAIRDLQQQMIATGQYSADNIAKLIKLTDDYAAVTGQSASKAASELMRMFEDPVAAAEKLDQTYHFLTADTLEHIKALVEQGDKQGAVTVTIDALEQRLPDHTKHVGELAGAWDTVKHAVTGFINAYASALTQNPVDAEIARLQAEIARFQSFNQTVFGKATALYIDTSNLQTALDKLQAMKAADEARAKANADTTQYNAQQVASMQLIDKYAADTAQRATLLAAKAKIGLLVTDDPAELAKQLEAIQKIDAALANIGKTKGAGAVQSALGALEK